MWLTLLIALELFLGWYVPVYWAGVPGTVWLILALLYYAAWRPKPWPGLRNAAVWERMRENYFQLQIKGPGKGLFTSSDTDFPEKLVIGVHPHTLFAVSATAFFTLNRRFCNFRVAATSLLFWIPVVNELARWCGAVQATESEMRRALVGSRGLVVCPGGMREVGLAAGEYIERTGFIRLAAEQGAHVIIVWSDQEHQFYWINKPLGNYFLDTVLRYPWPLLAWGHWLFGVLPRRPVQPCTLWVSRPITVHSDDLPGSKARVYAELDRLKCIANAPERTLN